MKRIRVFVSGVMAGVAIGLGGTVFLSLDNKILGALFFTVGLFTVCTMGFSLYTGRVCYVFAKDRDYALDLPCMWAGNLVGTFLLARLEMLTRIGQTLNANAQALCEMKLSDNLGSIFLLAVFCNLLIFIAVDGFNHNPHEVGKYLALFFGVMVFILCGFEHCVANMYYFSIGGAWSARTFLYILVMTLGNSVGGVAIPLLRGFMK